MFCLLPSWESQAASKVLDLVEKQKNRIGKPPTRTNWEPIRNLAQTWNNRYDKKFQRSVPTVPFRGFNLCVWTLDKTRPKVPKHRYKTVFPATPGYKNQIGPEAASRSKGLRVASKTLIFTSVFDDRPSFRAKGLRVARQNLNFTSVFDDQTSFRVARDLWKSQFYCSCLTIDPHFVRDCGVSRSFVATAPALREN